MSKQMVTFSWKDSFRNEWMVTGVPRSQQFPFYENDEDETELWWFTAFQNGDQESSFTFPLECGKDFPPTKKMVALALMSYFNSVALSLMTDEIKFT